VRQGVYWVGEFISTPVLGPLVHRGFEGCSLDDAETGADAGQQEFAPTIGKCWNRVQGETEPKPPDWARDLRLISP